MNLNLSIEDTKKLLDAFETHGQLFVFTLNTINMVFRLLTVSECNSITKMISVVNSDGVDEWVIDKCLILSTRDLYDCPAGYINILAKKIIARSSISEKEYLELVEAERGKSNNLDTLISSLLVKVFPTSNPDKLDMLARTKLQAFSETVLNTKLMLGSPDEPGPKRQKGYSSIAAKKAILSKENADKPNFEKDNSQLKGL